MHDSTTLATSKHTFTTKKSRKRLLDKIRSYWTDAPVKNCSLDVNVARQSDSLTENAYEYDRFQFSTETTNYIDDCDYSTAAASEAFSLVIGAYTFRKSDF